MISFHQITLRYFQRPRECHFPDLPVRGITNSWRTGWKLVFEALWNTCKARLQENISVMVQHRSLIDQARMSQIEDMQMSHPTEHSSLNIEPEERDFRRRLAVCSWLRATNPETDQHRFSKIRVDDPDAGRWLFDNRFFNEWFDPLYPTIPLLWLTGLPGAGNFSTSQRCSPR